VEKIAVEKAVGSVLAHDLTRIVKGKSKGVAFRKGHVVGESDIPVLKDMGKNHLYVFELSDNALHENDGAVFLATLLEGPHVERAEPAEGKVSLFSSCTGLLDIDVELLKRVNGAEGVIVATRHTDSIVQKGDMLAGVKIIPLTIGKEVLSDIERSVVREGTPLVQVRPFHPLKVGLIMTGSEVFEGRIKDTFSDVIEQKIASLGGQVVKKIYAPDERDFLHDKAEMVMAEDVDLLVFAGGMSVDPDDLTPSVIAHFATDIITYGSPVLPGAMFMMAYRESLPIIGVPACGMFHKTTMLDLVLPRLFAKDRISGDFIVNKAHGGLCLNCPECLYPHCPFGK